MLGQAQKCIKPQSQNGTGKGCYQKVEHDENLACKFNLDKDMSRADNFNVVGSSFHMFGAEKARLRLVFEIES